MLTQQDQKKYIKQIMLKEIGLSGQNKIRSASVAIVGCGGLGCPTLLYLAAAGVGTIGIVDFDEVHVSNLHRQVLFGEKDIGRKKVEAATEKISSLHPECKIMKHDVLLNEDNAELILGEYDVVVDGCDNFQTRYIVNDACVKLNKPLVYGSILGFEAQLATFNYKGSKNLRDLFPEPPNSEDIPDCSENGVLSTVTGMLGTMMANETIKVVLGKNVPVNKFTVIDCMDLSLKTLSF